MLMKSLYFGGIINKKNFLNHAAQFFFHEKFGI